MLTAVAASVLGFGAGLAAGLVSRSGVPRGKRAAPTPASTPAPRRVTRRTAGSLHERLTSLARDIRILGDGHPEAPPRRLERAGMFLGLECPGFALTDLDAVLKHPESAAAPEALYLKISALSASGRPEAAVGTAEEFVRIFPRSWRAPKAVRLAAGLLEGTGRSAEAIELLQDIIGGAGERIPPRFDGPLLDLGRLCVRYGDVEAAENALKRLTWRDRSRVFRENPRREEAEVWLAEADRKAGRLDPARQEALRRIARSPRTRAGRHARALLGEPELLPGERAHACAEKGSLDGARAALSALEGEPHRDAASGILRACKKRAFVSPSKVLALADELDPERLGSSLRIGWCAARAWALEALGRGPEAERVLRLYRAERLTLIRADMRLRNSGPAEALKVLRSNRHEGPLVEAVLLGLAQGTGESPLP